LFSKGNEAVDVLKSFSEQQLLEVMDGVPQVEAAIAVLDGEGADILTFLADSGVFPSKGEARKMLQNGGLSINKEKVTELDFKLTTAHLLNGKYILVQKGKSNYTLAIFN
jgi:tyrosyl-tRNA synthetase